MTPRSPKTVLTSPRMSQVRVLNPRVRVRVQVESTSGETESASRENGTRVRVSSPSITNLQAIAAPVSAAWILLTFISGYPEIKVNVKRKA
jgi:hypothetical protein